ncbi:glycosyltransferase family 32 protein [Companilactobacillus farciminis]|uniref:glycosyltransferase family 32 protein n=1 Tax=Companilactobacillus farciminis TaxID=1612 RepID=UPI001915C08E|nr:glycosyltransferase [Companilactobacillus farciminis]
MTIPKKIHYCWFGSKEEPAELLKWKESWKKYCPDYEINLWNEKNFDVNSYPYVKKQYEKGRYDLVSDYVRLNVIANYGGIYLDTDVEIIRPLDELLNNECFFGLENRRSIASGLIFGAEKNNSNIINLLSLYDKNYDDISFLDENCVEITTNYFRRMGFKNHDRIQFLNGCTIYPVSYFCPIKYGSKKVKIKKNTFSIHHYKQQSFRKRINIKVGNLILLFGGEKMLNKLRRKD